MNLSPTVSKVEVGDEVTFRADCDHRKTTRKVKGFDSLGRPLVAHRGYSQFILHWRDISAVNGVPC